MSHQPTLFSTNAYGDVSAAAPITRAHRADPATSHDAASRITRSGLVAQHMRLCLALVTMYPGHTGYELFSMASDADQKELGGSVFEAYRRLADLKNDGLVRHGEARICTVRGTKMVTWQLVESA